MTFDELMAQAVGLLQRQGWVSLQTLRRRFQADTATLTRLQKQLLETALVTLDDAGRFVWVGDLDVCAAPQDVPGLGPALAPMSPRTPTSVTSPATPVLVGRESEVKLLQERWRQMQAGQGQVMLLRGEAGIGKSRLVRALTAHVAGTPHVRWVCRCDPYAQHSPLYPIIDLWQRLAGYTPEESPAVKLDKLEAVLAPCGVSFAAVVPLLANLLSLPLSGRYPALTLSQEHQTQQIRGAFVTLLRAIATRQPVLCIVEDLHWADPSTIELLTQLLPEVATLRCYLLLTQRPEIQVSWSPPTHCTTLTLQRLQPEQVTQLATQVAEGKTLPDDLLAQIVARTEGVPLFVEDITQTLLASGLLWEEDTAYRLREPLPVLALPATLQESLWARLEGLGPAAVTVAQVAAVWGRGVTEAHLQATVPLTRADRERALACLVRAGIIQELSLPPRLTYVFKHALLQEAAYTALPLERRQAYHGQVVRVLTRQFPDLAETQPEVLAQHYTAAGIPEQAIPYWQRAGQRMLERSAYKEALVHLSEARTILATLPGTPEHTEQELTILMLLGPACIATRGQGAAEVEQIYRRAQTLCQQLGDTTRLIPVLTGLRRLYFAQEAFQAAYDVGRQLLTLAQDHQDYGLLVEAHQGLGLALLMRGQAPEALVHLQQGVAYATPAQRLTHGPMQVLTPAVVCLSYAAWALWLLGFPDQARSTSAGAIRLAQESGSPMDRAHALCWDARLQQFCRNSAAAYGRAEEALALSTAHSLAHYRAYSLVHQGWALAFQGQQAAGLGLLQQGLIACQAAGPTQPRAYFLALLAEVHGAMGQAVEGLRLLGEAHVLVEATHGRWWEAELYRLKGELLLQSGGRSRVAGMTPSDTSGATRDAQATTYFDQALMLARHQQAKSLELRAAISLSRLLQQQGKRAAARALLTAVYGWFSEGFDTADLQEAGELLAIYEDTACPDQSWHTGRKV